MTFYFVRIAVTSANVLLLCWEKRIYHICISLTKGARIDSYGTSTLSIYKRYLRSGLGKNLLLKVNLHHNIVNNTSFWNLNRIFQSDFINIWYLILPCIKIILTCYMYNVYTGINNKSIILCFKSTIWRMKNKIVIKKKNLTEY